MASKIIEFDVVFNYADQEEGIEIPLVLNANGRSMITVGFVDNGCGACLFSNEVGMDLGIDIESGEFAIFKSGAGGSVPAYGHPVVIEFLGIAFESFVYFAKKFGPRLKHARKLRFRSNAPHPTHHPSRSAHCIVRCNPCRIPDLSGGSLFKRILSAQPALAMSVQ